MENASKALLIAGGVLITLMVVSLGVYLFTDFSTTASNINRQNADRQLTSFNTQYTVYVGRTNITGYELVSVINMAANNNSEYDDVNNYEEAYKVDVTVDGSSVVDKSLDQLEEDYIIDKQSTTYKCTGVDYNSAGRVKVIYFAKN